MGLLSRRRHNSRSGFGHPSLREWRTRIVDSRGNIGQLSWPQEPNELSRGSGRSPLKWTALGSSAGLSVRPNDLWDSLAALKWSEGWRSCIEVFWAGKRPERLRTEGLPNTPTAIMPIPLIDFECRCFALRKLFGFHSRSEFGPLDATLRSFILLNISEVLGNSPEFSAAPNIEESPEYPRIAFPCYTDSNLCRTSHSRIDVHHFEGDGTLAGTEPQN
jgi:hypothetical protein